MRYFNMLFFTISLGFILSITTSCADVCRDTSEYVLYQPVYLETGDVNKGIEWEAPREITNPGSMNYYEDYLYINEYNLGIHVINNENPSTPVREGFIRIPQNRHFIIHNGIILANSVQDLVGVDLHVREKAKEIYRLSTVFDEGHLIKDENGTISHYTKTNVKKTLTCEEASAAAIFQSDDNVLVEANAFSGETITPNDMSNLRNSSATSTSSASPGTSSTSSTSRFAIAKNHLYLLSTDNMSIFELQQLTEPLYMTTIDVAPGSESIFPYNDFIFLGNGTAMIVYNNIDPKNPTLIRSTPHIQQTSISTTNLFDPVVANEHFAFVSIRSDENSVGTPVNQVNLNTYEGLQPGFRRSFPMESPRGLALVDDDAYLYVCDGHAGIKIVFVQSWSASGTRASFTEFHAQDILPIKDDIVVVAGQDGIFELDISEVLEPKIISHITVN